MTALGVAVGTGDAVGSGVAVLAGVAVAAADRVPVDTDAILDLAASNRDGQGEGDLECLVGKGRALDLIMSGRMVGAAEAFQMGLVNRVVPPDDLLEETGKLLRDIMAMGPLAVRLSIEAIDSGGDMSLDEGLLLEANHFGLLAASDDMKEGMGAFLEKRDPEFTGK